MQTFRFRNSLAVLAAAQIGLPAMSAGESAVKLLPGHYISYMGSAEPDRSTTLHLRPDGSATYTRSVRGTGTGAAGRSTQVLPARWESDSGVLTVRFVENEAEQVVEYRLTDCLSYVSYTSLHCSQGLEPVADGAPHDFSRPLWFVVMPGKVRPG